MNKLLVALAGLVALLVLAVVAGPALVPTDTIRTRLADAVRTATDRDLKIAGPIRVRLIPSPGVTAETVTFTNAAWATTPEMVKLTSIDLKIALLPLLGGRIEVVRLMLIEPEINLETAKDGRANWQFGRPASSSASTAAPPGATPAPPAAPASRPAIAFNDIRIESGRATYRDLRAGTVQSIDHIALTFAFLGFEFPLAASGAATWNGEPVTIMLKADQPGILLDGGESKVELALAAAPLTLGFNGSVHGLPPRRTMGAIEFTTPSLRRLAAWTGSPLALAGDAPAALSIKGNLNAAGPQLAFEKATIAFDAIHATGDLRLVTGGPRPILSGKLATGPLDLNPYMPEAKPAAANPIPPKPVASPSAPPPTPSPAADEAWSDTPLDLAVLHAVDADLSLTAETLLWRKLRIDKSALNLKLQNGHLHTDLVDITLYRGHGQATLDLDAAATPPTIGLALTLTGADINALFDAALGLDRIAGTGTLEFNVKASGASQRALVATLDGTGALNLADGQIKGVNLLDLARSAIPGGGGAKSGGNTSFGTLTGTFRIAAGVLHNEDLQMKSGLVPATGAGTVDLPARTINYRAVPQLAGSIKIPVRITGPWTRISYLPDGADNVRGLIQQPGSLLRGLLPKR